MTNQPEVQADDLGDAPQAFLSVLNARRVDGTRGVQIKTGTRQQSVATFLDYTEAVKLHEALSAALAFLDRDE